MIRESGTSRRTWLGQATSRLAWSLCLLLCVALCACGGGGSNQAALSPDDETIRAEAFRDEALARMLDHIDLTCTAVLCTDHNHDWEWPPGPNGVVTSGCAYHCVPSEIDETGEVRYFQAAIHFGRNEHGCFTRDVFDTRFFWEVNNLCTPNF